MSTANRGIMSNTEWRSPAGRLIGLLYILVLVFAGMMVIFPFIFSFTAGLHNSIDVVKPGIHLWPKQPHWENYLDAWQRFKLGRLFLNTAIAAGGGVLAQLAQIDGASDMHMFLNITLPLSSSVLLVLGLFAFIGFWGDFLWPFLVLRESSLQTISVRLYTLARGFGLNLFMAASFIAMIPPSIAAFYLQRHAPRGGLTF